MSVTKALSPGWAIAACEPCVLEGTPPGTTLFGPWKPNAAWGPNYTCAACKKPVAAEQNTYTVHPAKQRCHTCGELKNKKMFSEREWNRLEYRGSCASCVKKRRAIWNGDGPGPYNWYRKNGMPVENAGRIIGRLEAVSPPDDDPYAEDSIDVYWRIVHAPETLPGHEPAAERVVDDCWGLGYRGAIKLLRHRHGKNADDSAFGWAKDYRKRYARFFNDEPTTVDLFTRADVIRRYGDSCTMCDGNFEHLDHIIPISARGTHELDNVQPLCAACNLKKGNRSD